MWDTCITSLWESQKKRENGAERIFEKITAANIPNMTEDMNLHIQVQQTTSKIKKFTSGHSIIKLSNVKERLTKQQEKSDLACTSALLQD